MKKFSKYFVITLVALFCVLSFAACDGFGGDKKTDLSMPENVRIDEADFTLKWNIVSNATGYTVDIDGTAETVTETAYSLKRLTTEHRLYKIKVKATTGDSEKYNDSAYSATLDCEPAEYIFVYGGAQQQNVQTGLRLAAPMAETTGGLTITGLTNYGKTLDNIVIPAQIGATEVKAIGGGAFENNAAVTAVVIPATVTAVEQNAFKGCAALTAVTFQRTGADGVTSLESGVFDGCAALENIIVPQDSANAYKEVISEVAPSIADKVTEKAFVAIEITAAKTEYKAGEMFDMDSVKGNILYSDRSATPLNFFTIYLPSATGAQVEGNRVLNAYDKQVIISVMLLGVTKTANIDITVTAGTSTDKTLSAIEVVQPPKTAYTAGEYFDATGMTVIAKYTDGTSEPITGQVEILLHGNSADGALVPADRKPLTVSDSFIILRYGVDENGTGGLLYNLPIMVTNPVAQYEDFPLLPILQALSTAGEQIPDIKIWRELLPFYGRYTSLDALINDIKAYISEQKGVTVNRITQTDGSPITEQTPIVIDESMPNFTFIRAYFGNGGGQTQYTVTFNANGGTFENSGNYTVTVVAGQKVSAPTNNPTYTGKTFVGWYLITADGNTNALFDFNTAINGDITLFAQWENDIPADLRQVLENSNGQKTYGIKLGYGKGADGNETGGDPFQRFSAAEYADGAAVKAYGNDLWHEKNGSIVTVYENRQGEYLTYEIQKMPNAESFANLYEMLNSDRLTFEKTTDGEYTVKDGMNVSGKVEIESGLITYVELYGAVYMIRYGAETTENTFVPARPSVAWQNAYRVEFVVPGASEYPSYGYSHYRIFTQTDANYLFNDWLVKELGVYVYHDYIELYADEAFTQKIALPLTVTSDRTIYIKGCFYDVVNVGHRGYYSNVHLGMANYELPIYDADGNKITIDGVAGASAYVFFGTDFSATMTFAYFVDPPEYCVDWLNGSNEWPVVPDGHDLSEDILACKVEYAFKSITFFISGDTVTFDCTMDDGSTMVLTAEIVDKDTIIIGIPATIKGVSRTLYFKCFWEADGY